MDKSYLLVGVLVFLLSACGGGAPNTTSGALGPGKDYREITNVNNCIGGPAGGASIFNTTWSRTFVSSTDIATVKYQVSLGNTQIVQTCAYPNGATVSASLNVTSQVIQASLLYLITQAGQNTATTTFRGATYTCTVTAQKLQAQFNFKNKCLSLIANGKTTLFVPSLSN